MPYMTVPNSFVESATAYATAVNANFAAVIAGSSDGSKDYNINDLAVNGSFTPVNQMRTKDLQPSVDVTYNLGSAAARWNHVYVNSMTVGSSMTAQALNVTGTATINGNLVVASAASLNMYSTAVVQTIVPRANNTYDLGAAGNVFANIRCATIQPGRVSFSSGVHIDYSGSGNYMYINASFIGVNGTLASNDSLEIAGTAAFKGNVQQDWAFASTLSTAVLTAVWDAAPTNSMHMLEGMGSGMNYAVNLTTGALLNGTLLTLHYTAGGYAATINTSGNPVRLNINNQFGHFIKLADAWYPTNTQPASAVSDASGTSEAVTQLNDVIAALKYVGIMLP
jgi:cytoskeletal protein CcmA (bactofilin family)